MEAKVNNTVVGLAVVILSAALLATALWLSVGFQQKEYNIYAVFLNEAATGLSEDAPVKFNGVKVGYVKKIALNHENPEQVIILLYIEVGTPITIHTSARLISQGITGITYIGLSASDTDLTPLKATKDYPYPVIPSKPSLFRQMDQAISEVSEHIGNLSTQINRILDKENAQYLKGFLHNMDLFSHALASHSDQIGATLKHSEILMGNLAKGTKDLPQLLADVDRAIKKFDRMSGSIDRAGEKVSTAMDAGTATMNKLSQQTLPSAALLLQRIDRIADNLEQISRQMKQNPSVVIRGSSPAKPGPGER